MKQQTIAIMVLSMLLIACKSKTIDFKFTPEQPRAGEAVSFDNLSNTGEEWAWDFGDNLSSTSKSPRHTYRQPGRYTIILKVDNKNNLRKVREVVVYDTIPNFTANAYDSIQPGIYEDVTFNALVYNPYGYTVTYEWSIASTHYTPLSETAEASSYKVYFTQPGDYDVKMHVAIDELDTTITHTIKVKDVPTVSMLMRTADGDFSQRLYGTRAAEIIPVTYAKGKELLDSVPDGAQRVLQRQYSYGADGLTVSYLDGTYPVSITTNPVYAIFADNIDYRIYWAESDSVMYLPLIDTPYNNFTKTPTKLNDLQGVTHLAKDNDQR